MTSPDGDAKVEGLLEQLNRWARDSGLDPGDPESQVRSTGESNAAIGNLKDRLLALGVQVQWDGNARRYERAAAADRSGTEGEP